MDDDAIGEIVGELRDEIKELRQENQRLRDEADAEDVKPPAPSNDEIVESFFTEKNYAESSERPKRFSIKYFRAHIDDIDLRDATTSHALDFANNWTGESKPPKRATMLTYLRNIKVLYDWMMRHDWGPMRTSSKTHETGTSHRTGVVSRGRANTIGRSLNPKSTSNSYARTWGRVRNRSSCWPPRRDSAGKNWSR